MDEQRGEREDQGCRLDRQACSCSWALARVWRKHKRFLLQNQTGHKTVLKRTHPGALWSQGWKGGCRRGMRVNEHVWIKKKKKHLTVREVCFNILARSVDLWLLLGNRVHWIGCDFKAVASDQRKETINRAGGLEEGVNATQRTEQLAAIRVKPRGSSPSVSVIFHGCVQLRGWKASCWHGFSFRKTPMRIYLLFCSKSI